MSRRVLGVAAIVAGCCAPAVAHETWLMPSAFVARVGEEVRLDLSSGMAFPRLESPIQVQRIANASYRLGHAEGRIAKRDVRESSLVLRQVFSREGLATIWLDLKPRDIELSDDKVAEYLDEIDATEEIRSIWAEQKGLIPWHETYTKHAKTFVSIGDGKSDVSWRTGVGAAMELVPTANPCAVLAGDTGSVQLQVNSKPLAAWPVGLLMEGASQRIFRVTDAKGVATFSIDRPGRAMFFAVRLQFDNDRKSWNSDFCTMTFDVRLGRAPAAPEAAR